MADITPVYGSRSIEELLKAEVNRARESSKIPHQGKNYYFTALFTIYASEHIPCDLIDADLEFPCSFQGLSEFLLKSCYQFWAESAIHKAYLFARVYNLCIHEYDIESATLFGRVGRRVMDKHLSTSALEKALIRYPRSRQLFLELVKTSEHFRDWKGALYWCDRVLTSIKVTPFLQDTIDKEKIKAYASLDLMSNASKLLQDFMERKKNFLNLTNRLLAIQESSKIMPSAFSSTSPNISLLFDDDSTLFLSISLYANLCDIGVDHERIQLIHIIRNGSSRLSNRQLQLLDVPFTTVDMEAILSSDAVSSIFKGKTHIFSGKAFPFHSSFFQSSSRPSLCLMYMGLDFSPIKGLINRLQADAIAFNSQYELDLFEQVIPEKYKVLYSKFTYCPKYLPLRKDTTKPKLDTDNVDSLRIYFLAQAVVPESDQARLELVQLLIDLANKYPNHSIIIKLRQLKDENKSHAHFEKSSYESLLETHASLPKNLSVSSEPFEQTLQSADLCITCSSTAGVETALAGIPTLFYLSYEGASTETLYDGAYKLLKDSNLLVNREQILSLDSPPCSEVWANKFRPNVDELRKYLKV